MLPCASHDFSSFFLQATALADLLGVKFYTYVDQLPPPDSAQSHANREKVRELFELDGVSPYVWREGRVTGHGVQSRVDSVDREIIVAWVAGQGH